ncbi:MAG: enoyl-CoA hydratase [Vicinamibacterales bacterium]
MTESCLFSIEPPLAFFTFNRPEARNALTWEMYRGLAEACDAVDAATDVRVLVVRGAGGKAFAAGTDISQFTAFRSAEDGLAYERRLDQAIDRLERVTRPTIAQVEGVATGGGCAIALACDLRVCSATARFGIPVARTLGNCLSIANCARLADLVGPARFKDLMFTARLMDVQEAAALGLVTRVADAERVDETTRDLAATIAGHAPLTMAATKEMLRRIQEWRRPAPDAADDLIGRCYASADFKEGVEAFLAKRPPRWTGA